MIGLDMWILWVHILAAAAWLGGAATTLAAILPAGMEARPYARRAQFLTSRAMEVVVLTGVLNVLMKGMETGFTLSRGFYAMLALKMVLVVVMAGLQVWMGGLWRREARLPEVAGRVRLGLGIQSACGALAALLGLGLRAV